MRILRYLIWAAATAAALAAVWFLVVAPRFEGSMRDTVGQGDYELIATDGSVFTAETLRGNPSAIFFGFTHCPDVCPTTLGEIAVWSDELGAEAEDLRFWFVSVDPTRDSVEMLRDYLSWNPGVVGATGDEAEVAKAISAFRIYARKVPLSEGGYTMDHTPFVMLFDAEGRLGDIIAYQEDPVTAVAKLRKLLAAS